MPKNDIQDKIKILVRHLSEKKLFRPLYVRFRTHKQNLILPVNDIAVVPDGLVVYTGNAKYFFKYLDFKVITGIEALCDSQRKPFLLNDFNEVGVKEELIPNSELLNKINNLLST